MKSYLSKELKDKILRERPLNVADAFFKDVMDRGETRWSYSELVMFTRDYYLESEASTNCPVKLNLAGGSSLSLFRNLR